MRGTMWLAVAMLLLAGGAAHAAAFDPDAATRAYLATVNGAARARSDAYFEGGYWLILWGALMTLAVNALLLWSGIAARLSAWAGRWRRSLAGRTLLFGIAYLLLTTLLTLPFTLWSDFYREAAYGLGFVEERDSRADRNVIHAGDGSIDFDGRPMGEDGAALLGQSG